MGRKSRLIRPLVVAVAVAGAEEEAGEDMGDVEEEEEVYI